MKAGEESRKSEGKLSAANKKLTELGYPDFRGAAGLGGAPFDRLGDNLRGQRGIALDMYRRPEQLLETINMITKKMLHQIRHNRDNIKLGGSPIVGFALHKGADGFMLSSPGSIGKDAKPENIRAMVKTAKEYGVY